uniref:T cell receptor beta variable 30 n=1 Tax=Erpetoichthys calabaricus TaxID=27687 RepID=A0A8C4TES9_ERPCA
MLLLLLCVWTVIRFSGSASPKIFQNPLFIAKFPGQPVELDCALDGTSNPNLYWYRQDASGMLELLLYSVVTGSVENNGYKNFTAERPEDLKFKLKIKSLLASHTAVYYCAWSKTQ